MLTSDESIILEMMAKGRGNMLPSLETRRLEDRRLVWPAVDEILTGEFRVRDLDWGSEEQIEGVARLHREHFPELFGSVYEDILFPSRWPLWKERWRIYLVTEKDKLAATCVLTPSEQNMAVELSIILTNPAFRGRGIARQLDALIDRLIESSGAELGTVYCATFHVATQKIVQEQGYRRVGEIRGYVLANAGEGRYARDSVVMYSKLYNEARKLCPEEERLI